MSKASNIVELRTHEYSIDWCEERKVEINLDEYVFFECDYRGDTWHLIGHKCNKKTHAWSREELSIHFCFPLEIAEFIYKANKYAREKTKGWQGVKVSRFNALHYSKDFYGALRALFNIVERLEKDDEQR